jgi:hypothetical protein
MSDAGAMVRFVRKRTAQTGARGDGDIWVAESAGTLVRLQLGK